MSQSVRSLHNSYRAARRSIWIGLLALVGEAAVAQIVTTSPGYDPTPIEIPSSNPSSRRPIAAEDLIRLRDITGLRISPDGKMVAFVVTQAVLESNGYRTSLFVVGTDPGSKPRNLGTAGPARWDTYGQLDVSPQWSPDSQRITYLLKTSGTWQIWSWRIADGQPEQLSHTPHDVEEHEWSADGSKIMLTTRERANVEEAKKRAEEGIVWDGSIQASRGRRVMEWVLDAVPRKTQLWIYDISTRTQREATSIEEEAYKKSKLPPSGITGARVFKISPDGKSVAYISGLQDPKKFLFPARVIFVKRLGTEAPVQLTPLSTQYIQDLWWNENGTEVYFVRRTGVRAGLYSIASSGGEAREITRTDLIQRCSFDQKAIVAACIRESPITPAEVVLVRPKDRLVQSLVAVNPEVQFIDLVDPKLLEWTNRFGDKSFAYLVKPLNYEAGKRYPLVITTYRTGGFLRGGTGDEYPIQLFAANGFAVLDFDVQPQRLDTHDVKSNLLRWYSPLSSFEKVIRMLDDMGIVDPRRVGVTGLSYGADLAEFAITHSDLFSAAATSGAGGRDPLFYYLSGNGGAKMFSQMLGGWPEGTAAPYWKELSPALNVQKIKAPLLINAPDREYISGLQLYTALRENLKPVELIIYPDEGHIKSQPKHRLLIYRRNVDWFKFWLQDKEDADPTKAEQYKRWRELKKMKQQQN